MDLKQIHELIKIVNKSNIGEISIEDKDGKVTIWSDGYLCETSRK